MNESSESFAPNEPTVPKEESSAEPPKEESSAPKEEDDFASAAPSDSGLLASDEMFDGKKDAGYYKELSARAAASQEARELPNIAISVCLVELVVTAPRLMDHHPFYRGPRILWAFFLLCVLTAAQFIFLVLLEVGPTAKDRLMMEVGLNSFFWCCWRSGPPRKIGW